MECKNLCLSIPKTSDQNKKIIVPLTKYLQPRFAQTDQMVGRAA